MLIKGIAHNIISPIIGVIKKPVERYYEVKNGHSLNDKTLAILIENNSKNDKLDIPSVKFESGLSKIYENDIVMINQYGHINILIRANSKQNHLFVTEACNSRCLMCPQPPKMNNDIDYYYDINMQIISLINPDTPVIGVTGGEPTLLDGKLYDLLTNILDKLPNIEIHLLTNGRAFAWIANVQRLARIPRNSIVYAISLHSDYSMSHDYQAQARYAFTQALLGIHNLGRYDRRVEVRIIINKMNVSRLPKIAEFIYRNMPFVEHIAFMGLELTGFCKFNYNKLWINPGDYIGQLREAVLILAQNRITVSIYNLPLCILPNELREYSRKSITDWKREYPNECSACRLRSKCGGIFNSWNEVSKNMITPY